MKQTYSEKPKIPWLSLAVVYLLIATLISTGVSFAKYATSVDASGSGRVAKFEVTTTLASTTQTLDTTDAAASYSHSFRVTNSSEVAVSYNVTLTGIPEGVTATCRVGSTDKGTVTNGSAVQIGVLDPGDTSDAITLTFTAAQSTTVSATDISITVNAVQID